MNLSHDPTMARECIPTDSPEGYTLDEIKCEILRKIPEGSFTRDVLAHCSYIYSGARVTPLTISIDNPSTRRIVNVVFKLKKERDPKIMESFVHICDKEYHENYISMTYTKLFHELDMIKSKQYNGFIKEIKDHVRDLLSSEGKVEECNTIIATNVLMYSEGMIREIIKDCISEKVIQDKIIKFAEEHKE